MLNPDSLSKVVNYRYTNIANMLNQSKNGMSKDTKERIGRSMYMDLILINTIISSNPASFENIFDLTIYVGDSKSSNIFGVLEQYKKDLDSVGVQIPLINGLTKEYVSDNLGNIITAQRAISDILNNAKEYTSEDVIGKSK